MGTETTMVTGYQYGDDCSYIGVYQFPNNEDQKAVHLPPNTTLIAPPVNIAAGYEAAFNVDTGQWHVRLEDLGWMTLQTTTDPGT